jgi:subtilisin family serine protease
MLITSAPLDHGTMVASVAAGRGHGADHAEGIIGVAPEAEILAPLEVRVRAVHAGVDDRDRGALPARSLPGVADAVLIEPVLVRAGLRLGDLGGLGRPPWR